MYPRYSVDSFHCDNALWLIYDPLSELWGKQLCYKSLDSEMMEWVCHKISNFDYLMKLNERAGRIRGEVHNHPIFPWVCDFTTKDSGWRPLDRTKFRLAKGDDQLREMYSRQLLHHVPELLSDIGFMVYRARVESKENLCKHVRRKWVPREYPVSIARMYEWTPEECIPELYEDPKLLVSCHSDMPDMEYPSFVSSPEEFIEWHRSMLESEEVSSNLHKWIDLAFGYLLSGEDAVQSLNVHMCFVYGKKRNLRTQGMVQLFDRPHPQRKPNQAAQSASEPLEYIPDTIKLEQREGKFKIFNFCCSNYTSELKEYIFSYFAKYKDSDVEEEKMESNDILDSLLGSMKSLLVVISEICLANRCRGDFAYYEHSNNFKNVIKQFIFRIFIYFYYRPSFFLFLIFPIVHRLISILCRTLTDESLSEIMAPLTVLLQCESSIKYKNILNIIIFHDSSDANVFRSSFFLKTSNSKLFCQLGTPFPRKCTIILLALILFFILENFYMVFVHRRDVQIIIYIIVNYFLEVILKYFIISTHSIYIEYIIMVTMIRDSSQISKLITYLLLDYVITKIIYRVLLIAINSDSQFSSHRSRIVITARVSLSFCSLICIYWRKFFVNTLCDLFKFLFISLTILFICGSCRFFYQRIQLDNLNNSSVKSDTKNRRASRTDNDSTYKQTELYDQVTIFSQDIEGSPNEQYESNLQQRHRKKIILLKDSLKEKPTKTIKGIQMLPANYEWMVSTLQKRYGHKSNNRSSIVQNLHDLKPAINDAEKCLDVLEDINALVNQMESTGYNVRTTNDPMWTDAICKKFPYHILSKTLKMQNEKDTMTIEELLESLESEISSRHITERRMRVLDRKEPRSFEQNLRSTADVQRYNNNLRHSEKVCEFCDRKGHSSIVCRTINKPSERRTVDSKQATLSHTSNACNQENCFQCGKNHHQTLCLRTMNSGQQPYLRNERKDPAQRWQSNDRITQFQREQVTAPQNLQYFDGIRNQPQSSDVRAGSYTQLNNTNEIKQQIVLMTAEGSIWNNHSSMFERALFFFDMGAQTSLVEERFAMQLGLLASESETITMSGQQPSRDAINNFSVRKKSFFPTCVLKENDKYRAF
uniref:BEACH domain-containing protein n=1 Tax=Heterorhabditis bacteriophora TaxID=37862 RepID=A0A1I7WFL4_HETBA